MSTRNEAVVRELFEAWNERRGGDTALHFHADVELDARDLPQPDLNGVFYGSEALRGWLRSWLSAWEHLETETLWLRSNEDRVTVWLQMRMTGKGSGVPVNIEGGWRFDFDGERVRRIHLYADEQKALRDLDARAPVSDRRDP